jgi:hypothetical protein
MLDNVNVAAPERALSVLTGGRLMTSGLGRRDMIGAAETAMGAFLTPR